MGSEASITRRDGEIEFSVRTRGLTPGHAYTLWVMAFNDPGACTSEGSPPGFRCGRNDMGNPAAGFTLMFGGAGEFVTRDSAEFKGKRKKGDITGVELGTPGLTDP